VTITTQSLAVGGKLTIDSDKNTIQGDANIINITNYDNAWRLRPTNTTIYITANGAGSLSYVLSFRPQHML